MLHMQLAALVLAATTIAASGCGESSKSTSTATQASSTGASAATTAATPTTATSTVALPAPTAPIKVATGTPLARAQFIAAADAICARTNTKLAADVIVTKKEFGRVLPQVAIYDRTETNELSKLVPPAAMAHIWAHMLKDFQSYGEYTSTVARYAQANNFSAASPIINQADDVRRTLSVIAIGQGFKHCSKQN
jgi:hypothetical protein